MDQPLFRPMGDHVAHMRQEAKRCRDLAQYMSGEFLREMLKRLANDFEREADRMERVKEKNLQTLGSRANPPLWEMSA
jgi:hypothetical protein